MAKGIKGGIMYIDMGAINEDFTSGTAVTPSADVQAMLLRKILQTGKPVMICNLHAHASTTHYGTYEPFAPAIFVKNTSTSGHVKYISTNTDLDASKNIVITFDTTTSTGVTTVTVTAANKS